MPTYEYECEDCGHTFEKMQSITADPLEDCPKCSGSVRRIIHGGAGLVFKGSGFYVTDSRKGNSSSSPPCGKDTGCGEDGSCPATDE